MKVAVVGSGISGLSAAWLLAKKYEVHLFEADSRLGGHANTVRVQESNGAQIPIDTGFLVYNELTYPNLIGFFKSLQVETVDSDMSLSVQVKDKNLEWAGANLNTVFGQRKNIFNIRFHRMLLEILRFHKEAESSLALAKRHAWTLRDLVAKRKYSVDFQRDYLMPIGAAIWSTPEDRMMEFPAATFITFFINHRLLQVNDRPVWKTVKNGSIEYVKKAAAGIPNIHLSTPVLNVERANGRVKLKTKDTEIIFDKVIMATHAPITAKILRFQDEAEERIIKSFRTVENHTVLHKDHSYMPKVKNCWSSWNVLGTLNEQQARKVCLTYYLNKLQPLQTQHQYFVTLNSTQLIQHIEKELHYDHPQFDQLAINAQKEIPLIQGNDGIYYAGAWLRYGFHEDGILSAVNIAKSLGVHPPWENE